MFFFNRKKKLDVETFWKKKADYLFSPEWVDFANVWKVQCGESFFNVDNEVYYKHFRAVCIQLIGIIISRKNVRRERRYDLMEKRNKYLENINACEIAELYSKYNSLFGSSFQDGVRPMAQEFGISMSSENSKKIEDFFYDTFYSILSNMFSELNNYKLI